MSLNTEFRSLAAELLATFEAMPCTIRTTVSAFDPLTGAVVDTNTDTTATTVIKAEKTLNRDGKTVMETVATLAAIAVPVAPQAGDFIIASGKTYRIADVLTVAPSGVAIVYKCKLGDL